MKFRCERDTLADAVATAQRTVASRSGALPVLQDLRITADRPTGSSSSAPTSRSPTACRSRPRSRRPGVAVVPKLLGEIVRKLEPGPVTVAVTGDEARDHRGPVLHVVAAEAGRGLPAARRRATARACGSTRPRSRRALRQVVRAASKDDLRPILTGVLLTAHAGGLRLVATDSYRLAVRDLKGVSMLEEGQRVLVAAKGLAEVQRLAGDGEIEVVLASATSCSARRAPRSPRG